jgi:hypothetical protein
MPHGNKPLDVVAITERNDKTYWQRCGAAFKNRDGSLTLLLDTIPLSGKLQVREPKPREDRPPQSRDDSPPPIDDDEIPF